jgi:LDH2 family malate/lactate/ureidoglycolate dehydrogenase
MNAFHTAAETKSRISPKCLRQVVSRIYQSEGVPPEDADFVADTLVQAELWGHHSHGVLRVGWYHARLRSGAMKPITQPRTVVDSGAIAVIDGEDGIGQIVARNATNEAVRRAKAHGVGVVSVRNSNHFGTCMYYTGMGAREGCIMLLTSNAGPNMAPWGGLKKMIGTNPWSVAAPAGRYPPMIMDMANSGVARGKIYLAQQRRASIPSTWAIDKNGNPTTDPEAALEGFILPMAGHKGYAIGVIVDMLSGVLSGSAFLDDVHGPYDPINKSGAGHFFVALNVEAFQSRSQFEARMEEYIARLKKVPVAPGHEDVFYPGEIEARNDRKNREQGIVLPEDTLLGLATLAEAAGVRDFTLTG